jgi:hypothetical protein
MEITLKEARKAIEFIVDNNRALQDKGIMPVAIGIEGASGIGKSSVIDQIAQDRGYNYIVLSLSQIQDTSDLVGYPIKEHYVCKEDGSECKWVPSELLEIFSNEGWVMTEETRMSYAVPMWLKTIDQSKPLILNLDDYSRATPHLLQACNELILRQKYISWELPKYSTVICSSNPDDGEYQVNTLDEAQKSRLINFDVKFSIADWAAWAERQELDSRGINFLLQYHTELMDRSKTKCAKVNARNYTMFINTISGIKDWSSSENLAFILQLASGCFLDDHEDVVGHLFSTFIANKLDKLPTPEVLVTQKWDTLAPKLEALLYENNIYRPDLASILSTRFCNYSLMLFEKKGTKTDVVVDRILEIIDNKKILFSEDLIFNLIKTLNKMYPARCNKMLMNPKIIAKLI